MIRQSAPSANPTLNPTLPQNINPNLHPSLANNQSPNFNPSLSPNLHPSLNPNLHSSLSPNLSSNNALSGMSPTQFPNNPNEAANLQLQHLNALLGTLYAITSNYQSQANQNQYNPSNVMPLYAHQYPHGQAYPAMNGTVMHNGTIYASPLHLDVPQGIQISANPSAVQITEKPKAVEKRNTPKNLLERTGEGQAVWISENRPNHVAAERSSAYFVKNDLPNQIESSETITKTDQGEPQDRLYDDTSTLKQEQASTSKELREFDELNEQLRPESLETIPLDLIKHLVYKEMQANKMKYEQLNKEKPREQQHFLNTMKENVETASTSSVITNDATETITPSSSIADDLSDFQDVSVENINSKTARINETNPYEQMRDLSSINPNYLSEIPEAPSVYEILKPELLKAVERNSRFQNSLQGIKVPVTCMHCGGDQKVIFTWSKPVRFRVHTITITDEEEIMEGRRTECGCIKTPDDVVIVRSNGNQDLMSIRRDAASPLQETIPQTTCLHSRPRPSRFPWSDLMDSPPAITPRMAHYNEYQNPASSFGFYPTRMNNYRNNLLNYYFMT